MISHKNTKCGIFYVSDNCRLLFFHFISDGAQMEKYTCTVVQSQCRLTHLSVSAYFYDLCKGEIQTNIVLLHSRSQLQKTWWW